MIRGSVVLPEFTKTMWVSEVARSMWESRIRAISLYIMEMERETVRTTNRCAIQSINPDAFSELVSWASANKLAILSLYLEPMGSTYRSLPVPYKEGPFNIRVAIAPLHLAKPFMEAWYEGDNDRIGALLGYPWCCRKSFQKAWVDEKFLDDTWIWASNSKGIRSGDTITVDGYPEANILLRWMGPRAVPHLPCSPNCIMTRLAAKEFNDSTREEYKWIIEMLSWPVEWSALHGIARIKTPIMEISSRTDFTDTLYTVRRTSREYPKEGARGLVFPFRSASEQEASLWEDNGFNTLFGMEAGHEIVISALPNESSFKSIWDLGCGNGLLLDKIGKKLGVTNLVGVDVKDHFPRRYIGSFIKGDIRQASPAEEDQPALAIISENRLKEIPELGKILRGYSGYVVYSYEQMKASYTPNLGELR